MCRNRIGFCTDVEETKVASRAFTIIHILLGASCVGGALVLLVQSVLEGVASRSSAVYRLILERDSFKKAFSGKPALSSWVSRKEKGVLSYAEFRAVLKDNGLELIDREFERVCLFYDPQQEGCIRYNHFNDNFMGVKRIIPMTRFVNYKSFPLRTAAHAWEMLSSLFTNENYRIYLIFALWVAMGVTWGIVGELLLIKTCYGSDLLEMAHRTSPESLRPRLGSNHSYSFCDLSVGYGRAHCSSSRFKRYLARGCSNILRFVLPLWDPTDGTDNGYCSQAARGVVHHRGRTRSDNTPAVTLRAEIRK